MTEREIAGLKAEVVMAGGTAKRAHSCGADYSALLRAMEHRARRLPEPDRLELMELATPKDYGSRMKASDPICKAMDREMLDAVKYVLGP